MPRIFKRGIHRIFGPIAQKGAFSLADQVVVSGANFVTTIMVGRVCGPEELANYALGFSLVILILSVLHTLITIPYTIYHHQLTGNMPAEYRGAVIIQSGVLSILAAIVLVTWGAVIKAAGIQQGLALVLHVLSAAIPFYIFREFARHLAFAHLNSEKALLLDSSTATIQLGGLALLAAGGWLSAVTAIAVAGAANAIISITWFIFSRKTFVIHWKRTLPMMRRNWSLGRWILASRMTTHLNSEIYILWLLTFALGEQLTGIFAACTTVIHFSNPFIIGIGQILTPRISQVLVHNGPHELRRVVRKAFIFMGTVLGVFCLLVFFYGDPVMRIIYGPQYGGYTSTITVLSFSVLFMGIGLPTLSGLWAIERSDVTFKAGLIGLFVTAPLAFLLVHPFGLRGVAIALTLGKMTTSLANWVFFQRLAGDELEAAGANNAPHKTSRTIP